jgi:uncharacterized protein YbjT (DUF2867 family)
MSIRPILVTGATGKVGTRVIARLRALGQTVRGVSRHSSPPFDWTLPETWGTALEGVSAVYLAFSPDLAMSGAENVVSAFIAAAKRAGVEHIVLLSGRGERGAQRCEQLVQRSGLRWHVVRCSWFFQNFTEGLLRDAIQTGVFALPAGSVKDPLVDAEDIADVVVAALTGGLPDTVFEVTGPHLMTFFEVAQHLSHALQRPVSYVPMDAGQFRAALAASQGHEVAALLTAICEEVFQGHNQWLGDGVQRATGKMPRDFVGFCSAAAAAGMWERA